MKYAIGLDIGGTKIEGVLADQKGNVVLKMRTETRARSSADKIIDRIVSVIKKLKIKPIVGVGISMPGYLIDDKVEGCGNIPSIGGLKIRQMLQNKLSIPVVVENDANCFALAEYMFGAAKGRQNVFGLIVGTGVGGGIIVNGEMYRGILDSAGHLGQCIIDPFSKIADNRGRKGSVESFCSGPNLLKHYKSFRGKQDLDVKSLFKSKDQAAKKTIKLLYTRLGQGLSIIVNLLNPDVIVLGGGISNSLNTTKLYKVIKKKAMSAPAKHVKIVRNKLGDSSGVLGAIALVFHKK